MALTIEVRLNGRLIGSVEAINVSSLAPLSDYEVAAASVPLDDENGYAHPHVFVVEGHERRLGAWALVEKIAAQLWRNEAGQ